MFKNSSELLNCALQKLNLAIEKGTSKVEILLDERFSSDTPSVKKLCDKLEIKKITELLREKFETFTLKSEVISTGHLKASITFTHGPCVMFYPLVWVLTLEEK